MTWVGFAGSFGWLSKRIKRLAKSFCVALPKSVGKQERVILASERTLSSQMQMNILMAPSAEGDQILLGIVPEQSPRLGVVHLQTS